MGNHPGACALWPSRRRSMIRTLQSRLRGGGAAFPHPATLLSPSRPSLARVGWPPRELPQAGSAIPRKGMSRSKLAEPFAIPRPCPAEGCSTPVSCHASRNGLPLCTGLPCWEQPLAGNSTSKRTLQKASGHPRTGGLPRNAPAEYARRPQADACGCRSGTFWCGCSGRGNFRVWGGHERHSLAKGCPRQKPCCASTRHTNRRHPGESLNNRSTPNRRYRLE